MQCYCLSIGLPKGETDIRRVVYLAGPMSGIDGWNHAAFNQAAEKIRSAHGFFVINPAENFNGITSLPYKNYMALSTVQVSICDEVCFLPGWEKSRGANFEMLLAIMLKKDVFKYPSLDEREEKKIHLSLSEIFEDLKVSAEDDENVLLKANNLVHGDRNISYGSPVDDFKRTVGMINSLLAHKLKESLTSEDFARIMVCCKLSRSVHMYKADNYVDGAGYLECANWCAREEGSEGD